MFSWIPAFAGMTAGALINVAVYSKVVEGLVDTGAMFTQVPSNLVAQIGIVPSGTRAVHYADGTKDVVPVAKADVAIDDVETATMVLCSKPNSLVLLGATTLETLGLGVDPLHKRLIPIEAPMA